MKYNFKRLESFTLKPVRCFNELYVKVTEGDEEFVDIVCGDKQFKKLVVDTDGSSITIDAHTFAIVDKLEIFVQSRSLQKIQIAGSADFDCQKTAPNCSMSFTGGVNADLKLNAQQLKLSSAGALNLQLDGNVNTLEVTSAGSSNISLSGSGTNCTFRSSGSTNVAAEHFNCDVVQIDSSGVSRFTVNAVEKLGIVISGSGKLVYTGSPEIIFCRTSGAVSVNRQ